MSTLPSHAMFSASLTPRRLARSLCPVFPILGVFGLKGQPKRDGGIIVRSCKASQTSGVPHQTASHLDQLDLHAPQRPVPDRLGQTQPAKEVPKVVRQNEQRQSHPVGHEPLARQPSPVQGVLPLLDPLLGCPAPTRIGAGPEPIKALSVDGKRNRTLKTP